MSPKSEYLVADTTAFIQNAPLQEMGKNIVTVQEVVNEITSKRQLRRLVVLPYDLKIMNVFPENVTFITEFSKKTGDYPSLSATDIKLMALVYQLEKQNVGSDHLKSIPENMKTVSFKPPQLPSPDPVGFFKGESESEINIDILDSIETPETNTQEESENQINSDKPFAVSLERIEKNDSEINDKSQTSLEDEFSEMNVHDVLCPVSEDENESEESEEEEDDSDWITPENIKQVKQQMDFGITEDKEVSVGCITTDFAIQNVLKQIGLNIVGLDGRVIKHLRTFILRCYSCFKTTSNMTKAFCPKCGNKTLKKVAVSVDENGQQVIHINPRKKLTARGKRFSLPTPMGGKHSHNPILCEDQPMPNQRPTRLARTKTNPLDDDYIAGFSPFVMRDVYSKSAMLGVQGKNQQVKYWMRKNPNEVFKYGKKKK